MIDGTKYVRRDYLAGTAMVITLPILLMKPGREVAGRFSLTRRYPVFDRGLSGRSGYCSDCGSKVGTSEVLEEW